MGTIDRILELQEEYRTLAAEWQGINQQLKTLDTQYGGGRERRKTRLEEINQQLSETVRVEPDEHGDFDARHDLRVSGTTRTWANVRGCPECDRIRIKYGTAALNEERVQIYDWNKELNGYRTRLRELYELCGATITEINKQARYLGLPSFQAEVKDGSGFITETDTVNDFSARGKYLLDSGIYVNYGTTKAVLDNSEQLVAYRVGDSDWTVMTAGAKPRIVANRGWYTVLRQGGTVELMIDPNGEITNSYPHVHVIHDEHSNEIRVVASRSSTDHSPPQILPGDASGNEVNTAVERAIRLL